MWANARVAYSGTTSKSQRTRWQPLRVGRSPGGIPSTLCIPAEWLVRSVPSRARRGQSRYRPKRRAAVRRGHHRPPGRSRDLPGHRRPARRRHGAGGPGRGPTGGTAVRRGDNAYQDALAIYRETGDQYREGITLENLEGARAAAGLTPTGAPGAAYSSDGLHAIAGLVVQAPAETAA